MIYDDKRRDRSKVLERYNEGSDVFLVCEVTGGEYSDLINCTKEITFTLHLIVDKYMLYFENIVEKLNEVQTSLIIADGTNGGCF